VPHRASSAVAGSTEVGDNRAARGKATADKADAMRTPSRMTQSELPSGPEKLYQARGTAEYLHIRGGTQGGSSIRRGWAGSPFSATLASSS